MSLDALTQAVEEMERILGVRRFLFPQQFNFAVDPCRRKAALCSRRAGKSFSVATMLIDAALSNPDSICVYVALTRLSAKRILWPILRKVSKREGLPLALNGTELTITFPNGSQIWLTGADDEAQIEKLRGSAYHLVIIDEAASFGAHLASLIEEVIEPALLDYNGTLCLIGTPGAACVGKFFDVTTRTPGHEAWSVHSWNTLDNPHIPNACEWLEQRRLANGWSLDNPIYMREWRGMWTWSHDSMVYRYTPDNIVKALPERRDWIHVLGVDLGFDDDTALQVVTSSPAHPQAYAHHGWKAKGLNIGDVANKIREYQRRYTFSKIVMDSGGIGKMVVEELAVRHGLPVEAAEKKDKLGAIELLNADLHEKRLMVLENEPVLSEWAVLQWDEKRKGEDSRYPNHCSDATLYAYRESLQWAWRPKPVLPKEGTPEAQQQLEDAIEDENGPETDPMDDLELSLY